MTEFNEDRYFDPEPTTRNYAREIYEGTRALPIVSPHGHVDAQILASNDPFPEPASLIVTPDHYILRMLYSRGVPLESLGVRRSDDSASPVEADPRKVWQTFAEHWHLFRGTPSRAWVEYELREVFGVKSKLSGESAAQVYDAIAERLQSPEFRPRALLKRFNIEFLATTDGAADSLEHHKHLSAAGLEARIVPTFRPDALFAIGGSHWDDELKKFAQAAGVEIRTYVDFVAAIRKRRSEFRDAGAKATDHAVVTPHTERMVDADVEKIFARAIEGKANRHDQSRFEAHMLMEMAAQSTEDGLVMQIHAGALRNHNDQLHKRYGPDRGGDIPVPTEFTRNLRQLLNAYGNDSRFRLIVFTLDESAYSRELAPLAGHYPALLLGAPWWFHDSIEGMMRFRQQTTETAGIENTAGFTDDTRAFCSIPARHDLARRVDANYLAGLVARHVIDLNDAREMARLMAYDLAKRAYRITEERKVND
ncbi:MAG TPA: glucuronate isomerase [Gemmatimonadaceae bacterium]|nr:glucuronate isomerase [Gemmatimonadaceae bacterium]